MSQIIYEKDDDCSQYALLLWIMTVSEYRLSLQIVQKYGIVCENTRSDIFLLRFFFFVAQLISIEPQLGSAFIRNYEFISASSWILTVVGIDIRNVLAIGYLIKITYKRNNSLEFLQRICSDTIENYIPYV